MKIHILTENRAKKRFFLAEQGLSIFIEHEDINLLFDTGQSDIFIRNSKLMDVDINKADYIVLSHGHYDHCGGLINLPKENKHQKIYINKDAFVKRYALRADNSYVEIGIPWSLDQYDFIKQNVIFTDDNIQIAPGVHLLCNIPRSTDFEDAPKGFFIFEGQNRIADIIKDEQILVFDTKKGLTVFLGCSHPGVVNCLNYVVKLFPNKKINTLVAGMHLEGAGQLRLSATIDKLRELDIQRVAPLHCTGIVEICEMKRELKDRCLILCTGESLEV